MAFYRTRETLRRMKLSGKKSIYQVLLHLQADFCKFAQKFKQRCQKCNQRVRCTYFIIFSEVFFEVHWSLKEEKIGVEREAFQHDYENNNQCFQNNVLRKFPWEHSKLQMIKCWVLINNKNIAEIYWCFWVGMPNLRLTSPVLLSGLGFLLLAGLSVKITRFCGKFFSEVAKSDNYLSKKFWGTWSFWDDITIHYSQKLIIRWCIFFCLFVFFFLLVCWDGILRIQRKTSNKQISSRKSKFQFLF